MNKSLGLALVAGALSGQLNANNASDSQELADFLKSGVGGLSSPTAKVIDNVRTDVNNFVIPPKLLKDTSVNENVKLSSTNLAECFVDKNSKACKDSQNTRNGASGSFGKNIRVYGTGGSNLLTTKSDDYENKSYTGIGVRYDDKIEIMVLKYEINIKKFFELKNLILLQNFILNEVYDF
ncbi:MAG: hypothetical protein PHR68_01265 [Candidatus Gracilibacteria bacterium]|nr:hypothetical protein [Candidatus Gracilibacteria bacterium]